jgi:hypothetical protein
MHNFTQFIVVLKDILVKASLPGLYLSSNIRVVRALLFALQVQKSIHTIPSGD